ncbi:hypothetical protein J3A83DRAFT_2204887 [Scleroderma citrinum]
MYAFKRIPRPLQRHRTIGIASFTIFFTSFLLFLLVGLSLTIIPSIYLVKISSENITTPTSNVATTLEFGVWGVCGKSALGTGQCYGPQLGYTVPQDILSVLGLSQAVASAAEKTILILLVLHLVSAALSTIVFVLALFLHSHAAAIIALIAAIVTALITSFVFVIDIVLVILLRDNVDLVITGAQFNVEFGNAVWMILAAVLLTWFAVIMLSARACYCFGVRRPVPRATPE